MNISVVMPAYLEAENLKNILPDIHEALITIEHEILVIDTMEPMDNTKEICQEYEARYVPREGGNFYGDAIRTGFREAKGEYIVIMDADGSHDPKEIPVFYEKIITGQYDLVIGSRYCKGGHTDNPAILRLMSWALNVTYRILFGLKIRDVSNSYRMYKAEQIKSLSFECQNFDIVEEILIKLNLVNKPLRVKECPISFNKRAAGKSKRDLGKFIKSYIKTIKKLLKIKKKASFAIESRDEGAKTLLQFFKFGVVGLSNSIVNYVVYAVSLNVFRVKNVFSGFDFLISQILAFLISVLWAFYWNNKYVFVEQKRAIKDLLEALLKTYACYAITGLVLSELLLLLWVNAIGMSEYIAPIINIIICLPINFMLNKLWAFKTKK